MRADWLILGLAGLALGVLPFWVLRHGYLPDDDALRHAAKAISGKPWTEILVLRPDITIDHNPGWHRILRAVFLAGGWDARGLVWFSVAAMFLAMAAAPLARLRRPEVWLASVGLLAFVFPYWPERMLLGRPLLLTAGVTLFLLLQWTRPGAAPFSKANLAATVALVALSTWVHGSWYLIVLLPAAFLLAGRVREAGALGVCWAAGSLAGAALTGQPWVFLIESARIPFLALGQNVPPEVLVREFEPFAGSYPAFMVIAAVLFLKTLSGQKLERWWRDPVLCMAVLGCLLGFRVVRFWLDWGLPALALWVAREGAAMAERFLAGLPRRLACTVLAVALLFAGIAADRGGRWSRYGKFDCLNAADPKTAEWMPEPGGILYAVELSVFYHTFYCNPLADWRYALGFEATFMAPENFAVYVDLCRTRNALAACAPWIAKMRPEDRLVLTSPPNIRPAFRGLEWHYAATNTWIGRLPEPEL